MEQVSEVRNLFYLVNLVEEEERNNFILQNIHIYSQMSISVVVVVYDVVCLFVCSSLKTTTDFR